MNSEFDSSFVDKLIEEALNDTVKPVDRTYGQLGFMESEVVSSIFNALDSKIPNATFLQVVQDARISSIASSNNLKITDLHTVTHNCRKCAFAGETALLPKWNSALFVSTLKESGFTSEKACLTYLLRCPTRDIQQQYIDNCVQYLHNEIQIMNPKLICTIGATSLSALLGIDAKIKDYKN